MVRSSLNAPPRPWRGARIALPFPWILWLLAGAAAGPAAVRAAPLALGEWGFWAEDTSLAFHGSDPAEATLGNAAAWSLASPRPVPVRPGDAWTFTATVAGRDLGWLGGGGNLGVMALDLAGKILEWNVGATEVTGTFPWKRLKVEVRAPAGAAFLTPRFFGRGGGSLYAASADFSPAPAGGAAAPAPSLQAFPAQPMPPPRFQDLRLSAVPDSAQAIYRPGDTVGWTITPGSISTMRFRYSVADGFGNRLDSGRTGPGLKVRFPPAAPGYYELRVDDTAGPIRVSLRQGAAVIPPPVRWALGRAPFGFAHGSDTLLARLGFSWTRPLFYDIRTGSQKKLPGDSSGYALAWQKKIAAGGLPKSHLRTIEVWNEPYNELEKGWTMAEFKRMVAATGKGARKADPAIRIAVNWEWIEYFRTFDEAGGADLYQVASIHPYSTRIFLEPPYCAAPGPEADGLLEYLEKTLKPIRGKEIWSTEYGWPTAPGYAYSTGEADQARFIVRSSLLQLSQGVTRVLPFAPEDVPGWGARHGSFGLRRADLTPKPSLAAYSALARTVDDLPYAGRFDLGPNTAAFAFSRGNRTVLAVWNPKEEAEVTFRLPKDALRIGLFGDVSPLPAGTWKGKAGPSPFFLSFAGPLGTVEKAAGKKCIRGRPVGIFKGL